MRSAEEQLARGDFKFRLHGEKLNGEFAIVRMKRGKGNEWLLLKKKDASAQPGWDTEDHARSVLTGRTQEEIARGLEERPPARASKTEALATCRRSSRRCWPRSAKASRPAGDDWVYEIKWDGVRAICYIENGKLRMVSRNGNAMDRQYPELSILPHHVKAQERDRRRRNRGARRARRPEFRTAAAAYQRRRCERDRAAGSRNHPVVFYAFDLLYLDGRDLRGDAADRAQERC